jgi:DVNP family
MMMMSNSKNNTTKKNTGEKKKTIGTRVEVWHGEAYKTKGGLTRNDLKLKSPSTSPMTRSESQIVSKKKSNEAKRRFMVRGGIH